MALEKRFSLFEAEVLHRMSQVEKNVKDLHFELYEEQLEIKAFKAKQAEMAAVEAQQPAEPAIDTASVLAKIQEEAEEAMAKVKAEAAEAAARTKAEVEEAEAAAAKIRAEAEAQAAKVTAEAEAAAAAAEKERQDKAYEEAKAAREAEEEAKAKKQTMLLGFLAPPKRKSEAATKLLTVARSTTLRGRLSRVEDLIKKLDSDVNEGEPNGEGASNDAFRTLEAKVEALSSRLVQEHTHLEGDERAVTDQLDTVRQQLGNHSKAIEQNKKKLESTRDQLEERSHAQTLQLSRTAITLQDQIRRIAAASAGPGSASAAAGIDPLPEWTTSAMARSDEMSLTLWEVARELESNVAQALDNCRDELSSEIEADLENVQAALGVVMQTEDGGDWLGAAKLLCISIRQTLQSAASAALHTLPYKLHRK